MMCPCGLKLRFKGFFFFSSGSKMLSSPSDFKERLRASVVSVHMYVKCMYDEHNQLLL